MRLIDKDALKVELDAWARIIQNPYHYMRADALHIIDTAPEIDAVPVVRCGECKYYENPRLKVFENCCRKDLLTPMKPNDYCSYGEKMEGEL